MPSLAVSGPALRWPRPVRSRVCAPMASARPWPRLPVAEAASRTVSLGKHGCTLVGAGYSGNTVTGPVPSRFRPRLRGGAACLSGFSTPPAQERRGLPARLSSSRGRLRRAVRPSVDPRLVSPLQWRVLGGHALPPGPTQPWTPVAPHLAVALVAVPPPTRAASPGRSPPFSLKGKLCGAPLVRQGASSGRSSGERSSAGRPNWLHRFGTVEQGAAGTLARVLSGFGRAWGLSQERIRDLRRPGGVTNWGSIPPPRGRVEFWILLVFCPRAGGNGTATRNPPVCGGGTLACQVRILLVFCPRTGGNGIATRDPPDEGWHLHSHGLRSCLR